MKLTHDIYTMKIQDFSLMIELERTEMIKKFSWLWLPSKIIKAKHDKLMMDFMELINQNEISQHFDKEKIKLILFNECNNTLPLLYIGLQSGGNDEMFEDFKYRFGKDFESWDDLKMILDEIIFIKQKYDSYNIEEPQSTDKFSIETLLINLEATLERSIDRNLKVYSIKGYYLQAQKKIEAMNKQNTK